MQFRHESLPAYFLYNNSTIRNEQFLYSKFRGIEIIASEKYPPIYHIRKTRSRLF